MFISPIYILNWYYQVTQYPGQVFSTQIMSYVTDDDPTYLNWMASGFTADTIDTAQILSQVLLNNWLPFYLTNGVAASSQLNPLLSGTYAVQDQDITRISAIATGIASGKGLPGGGTTFWYADIADNLHSFTQEEFLTFAKSIENWMYDLRISIRMVCQQAPGNLPTQPINIDPPVSI